MAIVGEAYILVRAITTEIKKDIANGFDGVKGQSTKEGTAAGQAFGKGFGNKMRDEATEAARGFHQLMRRGYAIQAGVGTLISSISALVGGLGALSGALVGAATSGIALVGIMAQIKIAGAVGKMAFKGVMEAVQKTGNEGTKSLRELREEMQQLAFDAEDAALSEEQAALKLESARETLARVQDLPPNNRARREAELAYKQAELSYRRAKDKNNDLQAELANPNKNKNGGAGQDPYKDLTKTQKAFAIYLKSVQPRMKELREAAASSFLPALTKQMKVLFAGGYFKMLVQGFKDVSSGLGKAVSEFGGTVFDPQTKSNLAEFFKSTGGTIGTLGRVLGNFFKMFITVLKAADPLITKFTHFLDRKTFTLGDASSKNFAKLNGFFKNAGKAAADFGRYLSNIFQPFKRLVISQTEEGSAGREFLKWMRESTESLREFKMGADGLTLDDKLKPAVESTKSIFGVFSNFARIFMSLGQNPAVKEFWDTLGRGSGGLEEILNSIVSAIGPELAQVIVTIVDMLAAFTDGEQIKTYFVVLNEIFKSLAVVFSWIGMVLKALGPLTGAIGALVTSWLLLRKVMMLFYGTYGIVRGAMVTLTTLTYKQIFAQKAKNTVDGFSLLLQKKTITAKQLDAVMTYRQTIAESTNMKTRKKNQALKVIDNIIAGKTLTKKQAEIAAEMQATLQKNLYNGTLVKGIATQAGATVASNTLTGSITAQGMAHAAATPPATAFGIALNSALWPIIGIAAAVALGIGLIAWKIGQKNEQMKKASSDTQIELKKITDVSVDSNERLAFAQKTWTAALSSTGDTADKSIRDIQNLSAATTLLKESQELSSSSGWFTGLAGMGVFEGEMLSLAANVQKAFDPSTSQELVDAANAQTELKEGIKNLGSALGAIAKVNLKQAQKGFIVLANAQYKTNLTQEENLELLRTQLKEQPAFTDQLKETAEKYALTNDAMTEQEKLAVYLDIALNRGAYAAIKAGEAQQALADKLKTAAASFIDVNAPLEKFTKKGVVDLKGYQTELDKQLTVQTNWFDNLQKVRAKGIKASTYRALIDMGKEGANLVSTLADSTKSEVKTWEKTFAAVLPDTTAGLAEALTDPEVIFDILGKKVGAAAGGYNAQIVDKLRADLKAGKTTIGKIMTEQGITVADVMQGIADAKPVQQKIVWDGDSIKNLKEKLAEEMGKTTLKVTATTNNKDGGLIKFANGGNVLKKFALGGSVFGQGGPRSDKIPAMLSNGEYVVNAAATARTLPLLNAINYGITQRNGDAGTMVGGGGGSLMNSVNITINPSQGMDEAELAALVSRELSFQMRRGASA
jgi:hypothetical protein